MFFLIWMQHTTLSLSFTHWSPKCLSSQALFLLHLTYLRLASKLHFNKSDKVDFSFWTFLFFCVPELIEWGRGWAGVWFGFILLGKSGEVFPASFLCGHSLFGCLTYSRELLRTLINPALNFVNYSMEEIKVKDGGKAFSGKLQYY